MSLVAYGSSDESNDEEEASESVEDFGILIEKTKRVLSLPPPRDTVNHISNSQSDTEKNEANTTKHSTPRCDEPMLFKNLPKPKHIEIGTTDETEEDVIPLQRNIKISQEKILKKNRAPVKISLPSLSEFKDVEEEQEEKKRNRIKPSEKGTGLFAILPPPKGSATKATIKNLIPDVIKKALPPRPNVVPKQVNIVPVKTINTMPKSSPLASINYDSDSDEEVSSGNGGKSKVEGKVDFFSLANSDMMSTNVEDLSKEFFPPSDEQQTVLTKSNASDVTLEMYQGKGSENIPQVLDIADHKLRGVSDETKFSDTMECTDESKGMEILDKTLTSNVINLPKEEIRLKNKAEVGPKLPVPEQEYNVDSEGNVAFDEKAIEYLCGKRGVKRKNKDFDEANIIEINGEDIKPDEREWLVKALTEEAADRPVSIQSAGPSTQSRKKHQITYLAHQAKAMEVELKNQWAQNRVTRKQTQSKYGF